MIWERYNLCGTIVNPLGLKSILLSETKFEELDKATCRLHPLLLQQ